MNESVFEALAKAERRRILFAVRSEGRVEVPLQGVPSELRATRVDLHHNHLPRLVELGYIDWSRGAGKVLPGPDFEEIEPYLEALDGVDA